MTEQYPAQQFAGMSILERMWQELDDVMDQLMEEGSPRTPSQSAWQSWGELRGQAQGVAYCIALVQNPYTTDLPAVKAEAKRRWQERQK